MNLLIIIIFIISLFASITNIIPLSASYGILSIFIPFIILKKFLLKESKINKILFYVILMLGYFFISTLIYAPESFLEYDFYRRDGNVFITFLPLLILLYFKFKINVENIIKSFIYFATMINLIFLCIFFVTGGTIWFYEENVYHFLFEAHNAAGGFLMMLTAFSLGLYLRYKNNYNLFILFINLLGLYETNSRGSILAFIFSIIMLYSLKKGYEKYLANLFIIGQIIIYSFIYINAPYNFLDESLFSVDIIDNDFIDRGGTFINRGFYLWPRAIYLFLQSPILGIGFGGYNDLPYNLDGIAGLLMYNAPSIYIFSDAHAHNTFLNVLSETGIVGLIILVMLLLSINSFIKSINNKFLFHILYLGLWSAIFSSVTEHRLFTPSQMIPYFIILGLVYVSNSYEKKNII